MEVLRQVQAQLEVSLPVSVASPVEVEPLSPSLQEVLVALVAEANLTQRILRKSSSTFIIQ